MQLRSCLLVLCSSGSLSVSVILVFIHLFIPSQAALEHLHTTSHRPQHCSTWRRGSGQMNGQLGKGHGKEKDGPSLHIFRVLTECSRKSHRHITKKPPGGNILEMTTGLSRTPNLAWPLGKALWWTWLRTFQLRLETRRGIWDAGRVLQAKDPCG